MIKANRIHVGRVVAELQGDKVISDLWDKAIEQSAGIDSLILAKYIKLRAEMVAEEDGLLRKT